jgi:hypothetical protein
MDNIFKADKRKMTEIQSIPKDWDKKIESYLAAMTRAGQNARAQPPGEKFEESRECYEATCRDFLDHISTHYGSAQGFCDFLQSRLTDLFDGLGLETKGVIDYPEWQSSPASDDDIETAERLSELYRINYVENTEAAAHHRAFHHAPLDFDL